MGSKRPQDLFDFNGKVVVVTGASQGIGAGICRQFSAAGASIVVHYRSKPDEASALVEELQSGGGRGLAVRADMTRREEVEKLVNDTVRHFGRLDVMINNAGIFPNAPLLDMTDEQWCEMIDANLQTVFLGTRSAARVMKEADGGVIINIASISASHPASRHSHYNSAKAGVVMFTRSAAQELGMYGIRVNSVSPGLIHRPGLEEAWPEGVERWCATAPLACLGKPEDVGNACLFLASPAAGWITGENLTVDGGVTASALF